jgi:hypothetical protein
VSIEAIFTKPLSFVSDNEHRRRRVDLIEFLLIVSALKLDRHKAFAEIVAGHARMYWLRAVRALGSKSHFSTELPASMV